MENWQPDTFEAGMAELEALVMKLEKGELPLEDSFAAYERGQVLAAALTRMLDAGEQRMLELTGAGEQPFELEDAP